MAPIGKNPILPSDTSTVHDDIGRGPFLALLFAGAVLTSYPSMSVYVLQNVLTSSFVGASGIISTMIGAACVLHEGLVSRLFSFYRRPGLTLLQTFDYSPNLARRMV